VSIDVDGLKARTDIVSVVSHYVPTLKKRGAEYVGLCVAHNDKNPSMWVSPSKGFVHCFSCGFSADAIDFVMHVEGLDFKAACERLGAVDTWTPAKPIAHERTEPVPERITSAPPAGVASPIFRSRSLGEPVMVFPLKALDGSIIAYECRYEVEEDGKKRKVPIIWSWGKRGDAAPSWGMGALNVPRPLYGLDRVGKRPGEPICITEGPKKADAASRMIPSYNCLSITGGAEAWQKHDYSALAGAAVLLIPDADAPGWRNFCKLAKHLMESERPPASLRIVDTMQTPGRPPEGWDVADAEEQGWTGDDFAKWCRARAADYSVAVHDPWKYDAPKDQPAPRDTRKEAGLDTENAAPAVAGPTSPPKPYANGEDVLREVQYRPMSQIVPKSVNWLWPGRIARGKLSIFVGNPGLGKSQVCASLASVVSNGGLWPVDRTQADRGSVVILSAEDDPEDTIRPRLEAAGADLNKVYILDAIRYATDKGENATRGFNLGTDIKRLGALLHELGDAALVIIDPITAYLGDADSHKNAEVRALLTPLQEMAAAQGAAVIAVSHLTKSAGMDALLRVQGSIGFAAAARAVWGVAKDKENPARRLFMPLKNNLGTDNTGFAYSVEGMRLPDSDIETSHVMWENQIVTQTADEVFGQVEQPHDEREALLEAKMYLRSLLGDGPVPVKVIEQDSRGAGHSWATVRRAQKELKITAYRGDGLGEKGKWYWRMP